MGKKRRLLHSKKFARKHDNHPRMKMLNPTISDTTAPSPRKSTDRNKTQKVAASTTAKTTTTKKVPSKKTTTKAAAPKKSTTPRKRSTRTKTKTATQ